MRYLSLSSWKRQLLLSVGVAIIYYGAARLGLLLAFEKTNASPVWPPSGIAFAAVLLLGYRVWPGIMLGALFANVMVFLANQASGIPSIFVVSFFIAIGNTLEAVSGAFLLHRFIGSYNPLDRAHEVFRFVAVALLMCLVSAIVGPTSLGLFGIVPWAAYGTIWFTWWIGDVAGVLILTPMLLAWWRRSRIRWAPRWLAETTLLFLVLFIVGQTIFSGWFSKSIIHSQAYVLIPFLL